MSAPKKQMIGGRLRCSQCRIWKAPRQFTADATMAHGVRSHCKACDTVLRRRNAQYGRDRFSAFQRQRTAQLQEIKLSRGCADCGYSAAAEALDFDHLPGTEKLFTISQQPCRSWAATLAEIEKCEVVCANCHRIRGARRVAETA